MSVAIQEDVLSRLEAVAEHACFGLDDPLEGSKKRRRSSGHLSTFLGFHAQAGCVTGWHEIF
jgi:hypothetical protein